MKRILYLTALLLAFSSQLFAQLTIKQADKIAADYIEKEIPDYCWLYSNDAVLSATGLRS